MTFPSGTPGGFPSQGPQQSHQPYPGMPSAGRPSLPLPKILQLATGGLGVLNLFLGFANVVEGASFFETPFGWVPALLFIGGAAALAGLLPGESKPGTWPAVLSAGAVLAFLFTVFQVSNLGVGGILVLIFGLAQLGVAVTAYLLESGAIKKPQSQPFGQGFAPQTGGFSQPHQAQSPFGAAPQGQPGQPGQQGSASDSSSQPTKFAQPVQQQPTTYAPQHGQFFQQPSGESSSQSEQPGQQGGSTPSGS